MSPGKATAGVSPQQAPTELVFTLASANRALVLVRKVVADLVARYRRLLELKQRRDRLLQTSAASDQINAVRAEMSSCVADLNRIYRELSGIGCILEDWATGLVAFPAQRDGRRVWLCWRPGEPAVGHWRELGESAAARKPVDDRFSPDRDVA